MPELPEVETSLNGIKPYILDQQVSNVVIRHHGLRWPIPKDLQSKLQNQKVLALKRRSKYILIQFKTGNLLIHLGMSGRLRILKNDLPPEKHDHVDILFANNIILRFTDPRRFGAILWLTDDPAKHPLLKNIGPEPLTDDFNADYFFDKAKKKKVSIKNFLLNAHVVAGVGNIYAAESLFAAGIHPLTPAGKLTFSQCEALVGAVKKVLKKAIEKGGTTLKDFSSPSGSPGYFALRLSVYGRGGKACYRCHSVLKTTRIGQRATVYCTKCQQR